MKRIIVADDDASILSLLVETLTSRGYVLTTARDGQQAWRLIQEEVPDVAILDLRMPKLTGIEVCRLIRADPVTQAVRVLLLTGSPGQEPVARRAGADAYLVKPFAPRELRRAIEGLTPIS
jgi:CheY-like chemotaxis protein